MCFFLGGGRSLMFTLLTQETLQSLNLPTLHLNSTEIFKVINGLLSAMI